MSHQPQNPQPRKRSIPELRASKGAGNIVMLTAYTAPMAGLLAPHCDLLLVGDSLGMVVYGLPSTLPVTMDMMVNHGAAVVRGAGGTPVIIDMPFGSYQESPQQAFANAARLLRETGCAGVKIEGGAEMADTIRFLAQRAIPVLAHVGLMPQHMNQMGGFKTQGKDDANYTATLAAARAVEEAGAFAVVVEGVVEPLAAEITRTSAIPTIGIGASAQCDGQVLVVDDMLGMFERAPRFVKRYADLRSTISDAVAAYADDVRNGSFPADEHCYGIAAASKNPLRK